jgi:hypothetical protein
MNWIDNYKTCIETGQNQVWICNESSFLIVNIIIMCLLISGIFLYPKLYNFIKGISQEGDN